MAVHLAQRFVRFESGNLAEHPVPWFPLDQSLGEFPDASGLVPLHPLERQNILKVVAEVVLGIGNAVGKLRRILTGEDLAVEA